MDTRRVVITGMGVVSSIGFGREHFVKSLNEGRNGVTRITAFDTTGFDSNRACEVKDFNPDLWISKIDPRKIGRTSQFAVSAACMALDDAQIDLDLLASSCCGVAIGTTDGESQLLDDFAERWTREAVERINYEAACQVPAYRIPLAISQEFNLKGAAVTFPTACSAGNYALGHGYDLICSGQADYMLCGGADSLCRKTYAGFYRLGTIAPEICQPFDQNRQGLLTGEGAGILFLESLDAAVRRNARIYAEVLGYGLNCDAHHPVAPDQKSIEKCMLLSHHNACVRPEEIDYISAHGTGTRANDLTESRAIRAVFGDCAPPTSSIKSMIGHTMGAASALASIACAAAIYYGFLPPTMNCHHPDPECGLDCIPNQARQADVTIAQNNAFAFGGNNAIVILGKAP